MAARTTSRRRTAALGVGALALLAPMGCARDPGRQAAPRATTPTGQCAADELGTEGGVRRTLVHDGATRSYLLHLPDPTAERGPAALIINLHGFGGSAADLEAHTGLGAEASRGGAIVATPDALGAPARWNFDRRRTGSDDYAFIDALVTRLESRYCIDPERVFVAGSSNGAAFAGLLACTAPYRFAAVAMVIATVPTTGCPDEHRPSVFTIRGTADAHVPFDGVRDLIAAEAVRVGCAAVPRIEQPAPEVERTRYTSCRAGHEVILDAVVGGTHQWPVPPPASPEGGYRATDEIVRFFADQ